MKKTYMHPETEMIVMDQTHIYTIISGINGTGNEEDIAQARWSEFTF